MRLDHPEKPGEVRSLLFLKASGVLGSRSIARGRKFIDMLMSSGDINGNCPKNGNIHAKRLSLPAEMYPNRDKWVFMCGLGEVMHWNLGHHTT